MNELNKRFLAVIPAVTKASILGNIARHYGITPEKAFEEVTGEEAEHILDYVTGPLRLAASVLMQRHGLRGY